jgi:hypothetical protein
MVSGSACQWHRHGHVGLTCVTVHRINCNLKLTWFLHRFTPNAESPSMKKIIRYIDQLTDRIIPNCSAQRPLERRPRHQVSPFPHPALLPRPSTTRSGLPITEFLPLGGSLIDLTRRRYGPTRPTRCTSFAQLPVTTAD